MTQLNIFEVEEQVPIKKEPVKTESKLTPRQWRLHDTILAHSIAGEKLSNKDMLELLDDLYGYYDEQLDYPNRTFNNLYSRRELTDDLNAINLDPTIQHVYVGGKYATSQEEINKHLLKEEIRIGKEWHKLSIQKMKASLDGQMRIKFNQEREYWESYVRTRESKLKELVQ